MKTKLLLSVIFVLTFSVLTAQIPQGVNYQALALDSSHEPISNTTISVRLQILSSLAPDIVEWHELHTGIATNQAGLFTLTLGEGLKQGTPNAVTFSALNWSLPQLYLRTWITYQSAEHLMGTTRLLSVPYALAAGSVTGSLPRLQVEGLPSVTDDALFEVKNKEGKTVFAVYNQGVRVYVGPGETKATKGGFAIGSFDETKGVQDYFVVNSDCVRVYLDNNTAGKAVKGGFAIGSFDETKGALQNYLRVTDDSIRMYIDNTPGKAVKGGFAIGSFDETKSQSNSFFDISPTTTRIINPSEPRILWYPVKNAFLAGQVLITDPALVGTNSMSIGYESSAQGEYSQALGYRAIAVGDYSTSIGKNSLAQGENSFAFGNSATATQNNSYAFGGGARATGLGSYAFGSVEIDTVNVIPTTNYTTASGNYSFAIGLGANSSGQMGVSVGNRSQAIGRGATAIGTYSKAEGNYSFALGDGGTATGDYALSYRGSATGTYSVAIGGSSLMTLASGSGAVAIGSGEYIAGMPPVITRTTASGSRSVAIGSGVTASGNYATVMGRDGEAQAFNSFVIGRHNIVSGSQTAWVATDPLFVIGNGTSTTPSNAVTVLKNGNVGIGTANPSTNLEVTGTAKVDGTLQVTGTASMEQNLEVTGTAKIGANGTAVQSIIKTTTLRNYADLAAGSQRAEVFAVTNVVTGSTVHVSPRSQLPAGVVIAYARVSSAGSVEVMFFNASGALAEIGSVFLDITVIR